MKFSTFTVFDHYPDLIPRTVGQLYREVLEQSVFAEKLGYDGVWFAEHHFSDFGVNPSPAVMLSALAAKTSRIRLGVAVSVLPLHDPLRIAEDYAVLDILSHGRLDLGLGNGYRPDEFLVFKIPLDEKIPRFQEAMDVLRKAWSGETHDHEGLYYHYPEFRLNVQPLQRTFPRHWIAAQSEQGAAYVGGMGSGLMALGFSQSAEKLAELIRKYKLAFHDSGYENPDYMEIPAAFLVHVDESSEQAEWNAKTALELFMSTQHGKEIPYEVLKNHVYPIFGSPQEVVKKIQMYSDIGVTNAMCLMNFGGLEHEKVLSSMKLFSEHVISVFR